MVVMVVADVGCDAEFALQQTHTQNNYNTLLGRVNGSVTRRTNILVWNKNENIQIYCTHISQLYLDPLQI